MLEHSTRLRKQLEPIQNGTEQKLKENCQAFALVFWPQQTWTVLCPGTLGSYHVPKFGRSLSTMSVKRCCALDTVTGLEMNEGVSWRAFRFET